MKIYVIAAALWKAARAKYTNKTAATLDDFYFDQQTEENIVRFILFLCRLWRGNAQLHSLVL